MRKGGLRLAAVLFGLLAGCGAGQESSPASRAAAPLPPAEDRPEPDSTITGRFPLPAQLQEAATGGLGYRKGLRQLGANPIEYPGAGLPRGQNFQLGWVGECAYVGTADLTQYVAHRYYMTPVIATAADPATGLAVLDASTPEAPELVRIIPNPELVLDTEDPGSIPGELLPYVQAAQIPNTHRAMAMNWFAIATHEGRRVMVAGAHTLLGVFDASDCRNPVLKSVVDLHHENVAVHGLRISADGRRVFVSGVLTFDATAVVDIADLAAPKIVTVYGHGAHDVELSPDEDRLYMNSLTDTGPITGGGLRVVDISDLKRCYPAGGGHGHGGHSPGTPPLVPGCTPQFREVAEYEWVGLSHATRLGRIGGRPYAFTVDEYSSDAQGNAACEPGWVRIIDLSNEADPQQVGELRLGVSKPENCQFTAQDAVTYNAHYLELDDREDTKLVFVSWYASGLRVFDVTDPFEPVEIAYLIPPATPQVVHQSAFGRPTADSTISHVRWRPERNQLWVANVNGGFSILQFTDSAPLPAGVLR